MIDYCSDRWRAILRHNNLDSFDSLWALECEWVEPRNERRGGWSGVCRCELQLPAGGSVGVFLKRQENHITRTLLHPFGISTFVREMRNILRFKMAGVPAVEPVCFAARKVAGNLRAVLGTEELTGYESLDAWVERWSREGWPDRRRRLGVIRAVASVMRRMHEHRIEHNCFYPKHVLLRFEGDDIAVRIVDLEKARGRLLRRTAAFRDLDTLNRYSRHWSQTDRLRFLLAYCELEQLDPDTRSLWRRLVRRSIVKRSRREKKRPQ